MLRVGAWNLTLRRQEVAVCSTDQFGDDDASDCCDFGYDVRTNVQAASIARSNGGDAAPQIREQDPEPVSPRSVP